MPPWAAPISHRFERLIIQATGFAGGILTYFLLHILILATGLFANEQE